MIRGETLASGAPAVCPDCGLTVRVGVRWSAAGWYIGGWCNCGPYSRESGYYRSEDVAREIYESGKYER